MPGQLNLFKSRRQRGIAPPAPTEFASQCFLVALINRTINPRWRFCHVASGEKRDKATAGKLQKLGVVAGWPDLQFAGPGARMVFLELKSRHGRLSPAQEAMRQHLQDSGFDYLCAYDADQAIEWLKHHGILRGGFSVQ